ncbi:dienelactone hydrolase family protein [Antrihabitans sp. YC3-6]|uniref:Dienelactone hydrolase family protein n=1 Tax=Antrihabitans stalagmiti TaxID=2799499 RepID=A0A934U4A8_9NOCA|nr:dienelactone hydrolase family protein [Antrihabitans stalagmiti]MBJ8340365.1 dienelactone hydrolase family protein [Antrihabitans stalagmiti]
MSDITIETPAGPIDGVLEIPKGAGPWPGVVVVHDMATYGSDIKEIARRIADAGFLAIAPNLYSRGGVVRCVKQVMSDLYAHKGRAIDDLQAAKDHLIAREDCTGSVGIAGFCMGGGFALVMASQGFDASAPFYPSLAQSYEKVFEGACPVVASLGSRDVVNIGAGPKMEKALQRRNIPHDVKVYQGAGHSFANKYPAAPLLRIVGFGYDDAATEDAWRRVFAFFGTHLTADQT